MVAEFVISAAAPEQFPRDGLEEVAFLGRSNVGKSSLINALVGRRGLGKKGLAFTSSRPGCTQTLNFYRIDGKRYFVDLPGYGYARVSLEERAAWKVLIDSYLSGRDSLALSVIVLDARRGWMEMDLGLKDWLESYGRQYVVAATKFDQLKNQSERHRSIEAIRRHAAAPVLVSAETGQGVKEFWQTILTKTSKQ